jgi:hypothetical protein
VGKKWLWAGGCGALITLVQVMICLVFAPWGGGFKSTYLRLNQWDSFHYLDILNRGYHIPVKDVSLILATDVHRDLANVGFFPGYPLAARVTAQVLLLAEGGRVAPGTQDVGALALLMTSQFFCFTFWTLFVYLLSFWGASSPLILLGAITVVSFPSSFFLVAGYSESLFLSALLGFILGIELWRKMVLEKGYLKPARLLCGVLIIGSGLTLSATRLFGLPFLFYPLWQGWLMAGNSRGMPISFKKLPVVQVLEWVAFALAPVLGCFLYFLFCYFEFGSWDLYFKLQHLGWGNQPDYWALFQPSSYIPKLFFEDTTNSICRASNLFIAILMLGLGFMERRIKSEGFWKRAGLYLGAMIVFSLCLSSKATSDMDSMVRYNLPVFILLILASLRLYLEKFNGKSNSKQWTLTNTLVVNSHILYLVFFGFLTAVAAQVYLILLFLKGGWAA